MKNKKPFADLRYLLATLNPMNQWIRAEAKLNGLVFWTYKWDVVGREIFKTESYDPFISKWLVRRFEGTGGVFIDVGANLGYFSCLLGKLASDKGVVIVVEPEPNNLDLLRANIKENAVDGVVKVFPVALGEFEGEAKLNVYKKSNRGRHTLVGAEGMVSISVPVKTLNQLIEDALPPNTIIDFMKVDVEGYEPLVMRGAEAVLGRVQCMLMEYAPYLLEQSGADLRIFMSNLATQFPCLYVVCEDKFMVSTVDEILKRRDVVDLLLSKSPIQTG